MKFDYDVIIIGSGPAGFACAMQSTKFDKKVLIVEADEEYLGGTWINKGTVPSKALREAAKLIQSFHTQFGDEKGRKPYEKFRMEDLLQYKETILEEKNRKVKTDMIKNEIDTARGWGKLIDDHTVEVSNKLNKKVTYTAEYILLATGSRPTEPNGFEIDHKNILNYESVLKLTHIPRRIVIVGSGIISFEYATIFSALGTRVAILSETHEPLSFLDHEIHQEMMNLLKKKKIQLITSVQIEKVQSNDLRTCMEVAFKTTNDDRLKVLETDHVLHVGLKKPNTENIGIEELSLKMHRNYYVGVDDKYRTSVPSVYAAGDLIGNPSLASTAFVQGRLAACSMFGNESDSLAEHAPYGIYSIPEIAGFGITEQQAEKEMMDITIGRAYYNNLTQADIKQETEGLLKLVFNTSDLKLLGVHIIGDQAADLIHLGQAVISSGGTIRYFMDKVLNYPTYTEAYRIAAFNGVNRVYKAGVKYKKILKKS